MSIILIKALIMVVVVFTAIEGLSRYPFKGTAREINHKRGWALVGVTTVAGLFLALI